MAERKRCSFAQDDERQNRVINASVYEDNKLAPNKMFCDIFNPGNIKGVDTPTNVKGKQLCLKFHTLGFCFKECKFAHGALADNETTKVKNFIKSAREGRVKYKNRRSNSTTNGRNNRSTDTTTPDTSGEHGSN